jgi:hypothetical protein
MFSGFLASAPGTEVLDRLLGLVDWGRLRARLDGLYKWGGAGRAPVDPVMLLKLLLLERLYQLSDGQAVWLAKDSLSLRLFLGLGCGRRGARRHDAGGVPPPASGGGSAERPRPPAVLPTA